MNCEQASPLIQPYADGELDAARIPELERHLRDCPACAQARRNQQNLKKAFKNEALFFAAPAELRRNLERELRAQAGRAPEPKPSRWRWSWNWLNTASVSFATVCLAGLLALAFNRPSARQQLEQELVSGHIRSLMADHALDVVSTDQHTIKPWFDGKLTFAPPVKDLAAQEFPLVGGRLDYLGGKPVAALVFHRHKHVINLFIWPAPDSDTAPAAAAPHAGYQLIHWTRAGMTCWAVSDLNARELLAFAQAWTSAP
ncbi:MAG TPA: anti-sigma factor [Candidatus Limnocylindria bacterium]|jgi:anti-sigma factor RsiW|nr:anti-sigma factor [Candidatus Limnocylindria bacterium]